MQLFLSNVLTAFTQVVILFIVAMVGLVCHKTGIYTEKASRLTTCIIHTLNFFKQWFEYM